MGRQQFICYEVIREDFIRAWYFDLRLKEVRCGIWRRTWGGGRGMANAEPEGRAGEARSTWGP